ncbi:Mannose-specific lectin [Madurella mycetomatis]|uniref:Mannose-specific lectin n=1 Tax=Madurella mycetomatis TaxID=100816 RepID=A0A175WDI4_9PEZI|nr:Mannose-specific lectin [Madurella mycetomatis]
MSHNTLGNGEWLLTGSSLWSNDGTVEFKMQGDGKIAVYHGGQCQFQNTATQSKNIKGIKMQEDSNLVVYDNNGNAVWATNAGGGDVGDSTVICTVQDDGNVVLYRGTPIWASQTKRAC